MSPAHIARRVNADGKISYHVRYRLGGRSSRLRHAGAFRTLKLAEERRDAVNHSLAKKGTWTPETEKAGIALADAAKEWLASRHDLSDLSKRRYDSVTRALVVELRNPPTDAITPHDVVEYVSRLHARGTAASTLRQRVTVLAAVLDSVGIDPNPARGARIRLPKRTRKIPRPPTRDEVGRLLEAINPRYQLAIRILEATGVRISEVLALEPEDVDLAQDRIRVTGGKSQAARRWIPVHPDLAAELARDLPLRMTDAGLRMAMRQACKVAGIRSLSPHDLRHRYISKQVLSGVPITIVKERAGHANASMTLDVYSHVILED